MKKKYFKTMAKIVSLSLGVCAFHAASASNDSTIKSSFSDLQVDKYIAADLYRRHPEEAKRLAQISDAVRGQSLYRNSFARSADELLSSPNKSRYFPLSDKYSESLRKTTEDWMVYNKTSNDLLDKIQNPKTKTTYPRLDSTLNVISTAAALKPPYGVWVSAGTSIAKEIYPYFLATPQPVSNYGGSPSQAIESISWALTQARKKTVEGKALIPAIEKLTYFDSSQNPQNYPAIKEAKSQNAALRSADNSEKALVEIFRIQEKFAAIDEGIKQINEDLSNRPSPTSEQKVDEKRPSARREEVLKNLNNAEGTLLTAGYFFELVGDQKSARVALGLADAANKVGNLVNNSSNMSTALLTGNYLGIAVQVMGLLSSTSEPESPYPKIFAMLQDIHKSVNEMRATLADKLGQMDARLGNLIGHSLFISNATYQNSEEIRTQLNRIQKELARNQAALMNQNLGLADLIFADENRDCLTVDGKGRPMEPRVGFIKCRDIYAYRAVVTASGSVSGAQGATLSPLSPFNRIFPYAEDYNALAISLGRPLGNAGRGFVNPNTWYGATSNFITILQNFPKFMRDIDLIENNGEYTSGTLDPMISAGEELRYFISSVALKPAPNGSFAVNTDSFMSLVNTMISRYEIVLNKIENELSPIRDQKADITKGNVQPRRGEDNYLMLAGNSVQYCSAEIKPRLSFTQSIRGNDRNFTRAEFPRLVDQIADRLATSLQNLPASSIQPGSSILDAIHPSILLLEKLMPNQFEIRPCIAGFSITNLRMENQWAEFDVDLLMDIRVKENKTIRSVQLLHVANVHVKIPTFNVSIWQPHLEVFGPLLVEKAWGEIRPNLGKILKPLDSEVRTEALFELTGKANKEIFRYQLQALAKLEFIEEDREVEAARKQLLLLSGVGLNRDLKATEDLMQKILAESQLLPTVAELSNRIILRGRSINNERERLNKAVKILASSLNEITQSNDAKPRSALLESRIAELKMIRQLRIKQLDALKTREKIKR